MESVQFHTYEFTKMVFDVMIVDIFVSVARAYECIAIEYISGR